MCNFPSKQNIKSNNPIIETIMVKSIGAVNKLKCIPNINKMPGYFIEEKIS